MNLSSRSRSPLIDNICLHNPLCLSCLDNDCVCSPSILQTTQVAFSCRQLIGLYGNHPSFKRRHLHLHMGCRGYRTQLVQGRSPQNQVVSRRHVNNDVPDSNRPDRAFIGEIRPQLNIPSYFYLISREADQTPVVWPQLVRR